MAVRILLLTGPPGAGKTTVLTALMGLLEADDVSYAALEVEALSLVHPWPDDDAAFAHVEFVARSFEQRGYPLLLVSATIEDDHYLRRLLDSLPAAEMVFVRLEAPPEVLRERLTEREPPDWVGLPRLLDAAGKLATSIASLPGVDLALSTVDARPRELAGAIRKAIAA
jgi:chloramphenicol 3-O-phosphotransferase